MPAEAVIESGKAIVVVRSRAVLYAEIMFISRNH